MAGYLLHKICDIVNQNMSKTADLGTELNFTFEHKISQIIQNLMFLAESVARLGSEGQVLCEDAKR